MSLLHVGKHLYNNFQLKINTSDISPPIHSRWGMSSIDEFRELLGLAKGERLDQLEQYKTHVWVYACTYDISEAAANIPLKLFSKKNPQEEITEHEILTLLNSPNARTSTHEFFFSQYAYQELWGNAFIYLVGNNINIPVSRTNVPKSMFMLIPNRVSIKRGDIRPVEKYAYLVDSNHVFFDPVEILHPKQFAPEDVALGQSTITALRDTLLEDRSAKQFKASFLKNSLVPSGTFSAEGALTQKQFERMEKQLQDKHIGKGKRHKFLLLENGAKFQSITMTPKDVEFLNQYKINREEILAAFGVPPTIVGIESANYAESLTQERNFYVNTIQPKVKRFVDALNIMLTPFYDDDLFLKPDWSDVPALHQSLEDTTNMLDKLTDKVITKNEGRLILNKNFGFDMPSADGGDSLYIDATKIPVDEFSGDDLKAAKLSERKEKLKKLGITDIEQIEDLRE